MVHCQGACYHDKICYSSWFPLGLSKGLFHPGTFLPILVSQTWIHIQTNSESCWNRFWLNTTPFRDTGAVFHRPPLKEQGLGWLPVVRNVGGLALGQSSLLLPMSSDTRRKFCSGFGVILFLKVSLYALRSPPAQVPLAESESYFRCKVAVYPSHSCPRWGQVSVSCH